LFHTKTFRFFIHYLVFLLLKLIINVYTKSYKISSQWLLINRISPQTMFFIVYKTHPIENIVSYKNHWIFYTLPGFLLLQLIINVYYKSNKITWQLLLINRISPQTMFFIDYKIHPIENIVSYKNSMIFIYYLVFLLLQLIIKVCYKSYKITWQLLLINRISPQTVFFIIYKIHTIENIVSYKNCMIFYTLTCYFAFETYYRRVLQKLQNHFTVAIDK
jgi:hypothetical protein